MALRLARIARVPTAGRRRAEQRVRILAGVAAVTSVAAIVTEYGRVWRRGDAPLPQETDQVLAAAGEAVVETVAVARVGYQEVTTYERALFNLFSSFLAAFVSSRGLAHALRRRQRIGPFRDLIVGNRHIHHFIPGIALAFGSGTAAFFVRGERTRSRLALGFGAGMGMTLDESALLLELDDVYWSESGLLSVQIALTLAALLGALATALRLLRRGEEIVLPDLG
ncbi:MAG TPA: hypothetical protein VGI67_17725 [Thermoleophilaceae bacterium]